jgi:hypothetical protein
MAIPEKPSARLTHHLRLITGQRLLRFSILKETPTTPQASLVPLCPVKSVGHSQLQERQEMEVFEGRTAELLA